MKMPLPTVGDKIKTVRTLLGDADFRVPAGEKAEVIEKRKAARDGPSC